MDPQRPIVVVNQKSVGLALILTIIFGGLGLLYATVLGGIIMICVELFVLLFTFFLAPFLVPIVHIVCCIWAVIAVQRHNKKLSNQVS
ncbi:hypothetical protein [Thermoflavimicrobium dichotomicum]|uniref:Uncharacterized protein n=1 Tax=Thermoflavimicrobium dichotomicum TaxID=46223 RepID=A0A1I3RVD5_9BACL|nr:hypothetical protein [Thermoflavimicrobium dichotomicum]SFJ49186.1 hypothetical protein SAMN05421852_1113 [Thermoflavimicrobium dichotomicum]